MLPLSKKHRFLWSISEVLIFALLFVILVAIAENEAHEDEPDANDIIEYKFDCPHNGSITRINFRSEIHIGQIEFICTSSMGNTTFGPFGREKGKPDSFHCPIEHYISSFHGSNTTKLNRLGIRCRHQKDMRSEFASDGDLGEENGIHIDMSELSIGARPASVTVRTVNNTYIDGIEIGYSNSFRRSKTICDKEWTHHHGTIGYSDHDDTFNCPKGGVIIGVEYSFSDRGPNRHIQSLKFFCSSSDGYTSTKTYGRKGIEPDSRKCNEHFHIGYFTGKVNRFLVEIIPVCVESGKPVDTTREDEVQFTIEKGDQAAGSTDDDDQARDNHLRSENAVSFDDSCYNTKGRRPVNITVFYKNNSVTAIALQYLKKPVALNCKATKIEIVGNHTEPTIVGYQVLGLTVGSTCSSSTQQICLTVVQGRSNSSEIGGANKVGKEETGLWTPGISLGGFVPITSFGSEAFIGYNSGSITGEENGNFESSAITNTTEKSQKTTINYQGPGAAVVAGYRKIYEIDSDQTSVKYHYTCEAESSTPPTDHQISITGNTYGNVHFQDYHFPLGNETKCTTKLRVCISRIKLDNTVYLPRLLETRLRTEVNKCVTGNN